MTLRRTAAASALAARQLARPESATLFLCGCGAQGAAHLEALKGVLPLRQVYAFDRLPERARSFARQASTAGLAVAAVMKMVAMTLQFPTKAMAPGTWVRMDVMQTGTPISTAASLTATSLLPLDGLDDVFATLRALPDGQALLQMAQNAMPKPGSVAFTAPVLMFLAAARGGDVTAWMGERVTDQMRNIRRADILSRIGGAMNTAAARMREDAAQPGEWKTITLPMLASDNQVAQIAMHYRSFDRESDGAAEQERQKGARFVLDLSLTRIGPLQIDGLSVGRQLDVTLRSEQSFSAPMREALRARYTDALSGIGFSGQMNFKADGDHKGWVDFREVDTPHSAARA